MGKHSDRKLRRKIFIGAVLSICVIVPLLVVPPSNRNSSATWLKQMQLKGEKFTVEELTQNRVAETNDSMPEIEAAAVAFGRSWLRTTRVAAVDRTPAPSGQERVLWAGNGLHGYDGRDLSWESLGEEIQATSNTLMSVHRALAAPTRDPGWDYAKIPLNGTPGNLVAKRMVAQSLGNAMLYELHQTNLHTARQHLQALISMAHLHDRGWNLLNQMVRVALIGMSSGATWQALQFPEWTESELRQLQEVWDGFDLVGDMVHTLEMERAVGLLYLNSFRSKGGLSFSGGIATTNPLQTALNRFIIAPAYDAVWFQSDKLYYLQFMQTFLDATRVMSKGRSWKAVKPGVAALFQDYQTRQAGLFRFRYSFTQQLVPNILKALETTTKNQTLQQLTLARIAIQRYELEHGENPPDLNALAPRYVAEVPIDYWVGRPLRYRRDADGSFVLYACGADLRDNGGDPKSDVVWEKPCWPDARE